MRVNNRIYHVDLLFQPFLYEEPIVGGPQLQGALHGGGPSHPPKIGGPWGFWPVP